MIEHDQWHARIAEKMGVLDEARQRGDSAFAVQRLHHEAYDALRNHLWSGHGVRMDQSATIHALHRMHEIKHK